MAKDLARASVARTAWAKLFSAACEPPEPDAEERPAQPADDDHETASSRPLLVRAMTDDPISKAIALIFQINDYSEWSNAILECLRNADPGAFRTALFSGARAPAGGL